MKHLHRFLSIFVLLTLVSLAITSPARAFDGRSGNDVTIGRDEVINDDLYVTSETFTLDGTVKGDVIAMGKLITINGTVEGDLIAAGSAVVINGTVTDDVRIAGAALQVNEGASIGDDLIAAGASLETKAGSTIGGDLVLAGAQGALDGNVDGNVAAFTGALELSGTFGKDVEAYVDASGEGDHVMPVNMYMTDVPISVPSVNAGLSVDDKASIAGDLKYTSSVELSIPEAAVGGKITRTEPVVKPEDVIVEPSNGQKVLNWGFNMLRWMVTLILISLVLGWLFPKFMKGVPGKLWESPWPSLGWGAVAFTAVFFIGLLSFVLWIIGMVIASSLTLWWLAAAISMLGLLAQITLTFGLILVTFLLTQIVVGENIGRWLLSRVSPELAEHKYWPSILGIVVLVLLLSLLSFPLLPFIGTLGFLVKVAVVFFGFGALWIWGRSAWQRQPAEAH